MKNHLYRNASSVYNPFNQTLWQHHMVLVVGGCCIPGTLNQKYLMLTEYRWVNALNSPKLLEWMTFLVELNVGEYYKQSSWGWDKEEKQREISLPLMQHIVAFVNDTPAAYTSFMETTEEDMRGHLRKVIYCYELQVEQIWQGKGIGQKLISMLEERAKESNDCQLVMLTCFKANKAALAFYKKNGYTSDETSPSQCAPSYKCDYEILSKDLGFK